MALKSSRAMTTLSSYCIAVLCLALTACAGGYYTSKANGEKKSIVSMSKGPRLSYTRQT